MPAVQHELAENGDEQSTDCVLNHGVDRFPFASL
jgi:hypothetical protein